MYKKIIGDKFWKTEKREETLNILKTKRKRKIVKKANTFA
jgi:hypothetical protein